MLNENEKRSETTKEKIRSGMLGNKNALKKMYYCCYENCYYYSIISQQELINHYIEYHVETNADAERLAKQDT